MINSELLKSFQKDSYKTFKKISYQNDNTSTIYGIILEMKNLVDAGLKEDIILLRKHMGISMWYLANWCSTNAINLAKCIDFDYIEKERELIDNHLEYYLQKIKNDLTLDYELNERDKIEFAQRVWISVFPEDYHDDFTEIEKILEENVSDNKIKYPEKFIEKTGSKYGHE